MSNKKRSYHLSFFLSILAMSSCTTIGPRPDSKVMDNHPQYWLTTSMYAGQFYDDDKLMLLDFRPFDAIDYARTIDGYTIYPKPANRIIQAGTKIKLVGIDVPDEQTRWLRPLFSPKEHIWVYLKVAKEHGEVNIFEEKEFILIPPKHIKTRQQINQYLSDFLSTKNPNTWILKEPTHIRDAIYGKRPVMGMNPRQLRATLGPALSRQYPNDKDTADPVELWHYDNYFVVFKDDHIIKLSQL